MSAETRVVDKTADLIENWNGSKLFVKFSSNNFYPNRFSRCSMCADRQNDGRSDFNRRSADSNAREEVYSDICLYMLPLSLMWPAELI
jgi:hypothetical protein